MSHRREALGWLALMLSVLVVVGGIALAQSTTSATYLPLIISPQIVSTSVPTQVPLRSGEATYYDGADGQGNCSFAASPQDLMIGAMNHIDYAGSAICGAFVEVHGPNATITIRIVDQCPGCPEGDIDLSPQAFSRIAELSRGRVPITWQIVSPPISGPIRYHFKEGSNQWWMAVQIRNHRNPIAKVEYLDQSGQFVALPRADYNFFIAANGPGPGPYALRVTDWYGNILVDQNVALKAGGEVTGSRQFPEH